MKRLVSHPISMPLLVSFAASFLVMAAFGFLEFVGGSGLDVGFLYQYLWISIPMALLFCYPCVLTAVNLLFLFSRNYSPKFLAAGKKNEWITGVLGTLLTVLYLGDEIPSIKWADWWETLYLGERHTPVLTETLPTLAAFLAIAVLGYLLLRFVPLKKLPPLIIVLCMGAMYLGMTQCVVWILQVYSGGWMLFFLCLLPFNCIVIGLKTVRDTVLEYKAMEISHGEKERWVDRILLKPECWPLLALPAAILVFGILVAFLTLFGQRPDSAIRAWTETADWNLSLKEAPPGLQRDGHYLCTVAARGHRGLVKPLGIGERHGHPIIVNRQLCVANAFEQILEERTPRFHRAVRHFYDTYGYPIARHIRSRYTADLVYLMMKPAEYLFLAVLYLVDVRPEDRIGSQYRRRNVTI